MSDRPRRKSSTRRTRRVRRRTSPATRSASPGAERTYEDDLRGHARDGVMLEVDAAGEHRAAAVSTPAGARQRRVLCRSTPTCRRSPSRRLHDELVNAAQPPQQGRVVQPVARGCRRSILDPNNGQVIAMASYPDYDPAAFVNGISSSVWDPLQDPNNHFPLNNRALQGQYAPGSTFKLVTAHRRRCAPASSRRRRRSTTAAGTSFPAAKGRSSSAASPTPGSVARPVNLPRAITVSSDVYFYHLGGQFWTARSTFGDPIQDTAQGPRVRRRDRHPAADEQKGFVLTPGEKRQLHEQNPDGVPVRRLVHRRQHAARDRAGRRSSSRRCSSPTRTATFANGGTLYSPNIAIKITQGGDQRASSARDRPASAASGAMPPEFRDPIMQGLLGAVNSSEGTAYGAFRGLPELAGGRQDRNRAGHRQAGHGAVRRHRTVRRAEVRRRGRARRVRLRRNGGRARRPSCLPGARRSRAGANGRAGWRAVRPVEGCRRQLQRKSRLMAVTVPRAFRAARPAPCAATPPRPGVISTSCWSDAWSRSRASAR